MTPLINHRLVEVEAIWGEPWRQGTRAGAEMGRVQTIYRLLQRLTAGESPKVG